MKIKKIPYYLAPWFLMAGASLTMGLLSFSGILAIWPGVLPLAFGGFFLSVAYEGEIYLKNIKGSLKKLFKSNQLERQLAKSYLLECFAKQEAPYPQFFKDYKIHIHLLDRFEEKRLDKDSSDRKRRVEKTLGDMEKWFAQQLFSDSDANTDYQKELRAFFEKDTLFDTFKEKRSSRSVIYQILKVFCSTAGVCMGLGTTYLLIEAFSVVPWLAALPVASLPMLILPMAVIAGVAYGLLVYNAMTDMIASEMVTKWFHKINQDLSNPKKWWAGVGKMCVLSLMFLITLGLSICTAGTWWTVAKTTPPLFSWMSKIPSFIMLMLNPLILSVSTWFFNLENVSETLEMAEPYVDAWLGDDQQTKKTETNVPASEMRTETWLQRLNPFRWFINLVFDPLRKLLFLGHLASIGATADQVPGIPPILPAILGAASEGVEDFHYFKLGKDEPHEHNHDLIALLKKRLEADSGHNHGNDLPTICLTFLFSPVHLLAASWDFICSRERKKWDSLAAVGTAFMKSWNKETGTPEEETVEFEGQKSCCTQEKDLTKVGSFGTPIKAHTAHNNAWQFEQAAYRVERYKEKFLQGAWIGSALAEQKIQELTKLQGIFHEKSNHELDPKSKNSSDLNALMTSHLTNVPSVYNEHRFFLYKSNGKPGTLEFLEGLSERIILKNSKAALN